MAKYAYCALISQDSRTGEWYSTPVSFARAYWAAYNVDAVNFVQSTTGIESSDASGVWACKYLGDEYTRLSALANDDETTANYIENSFRAAMGFRAQDMNSALNESGIKVAVVESPNCRYSIEHNAKLHLTESDKTDGPTWIRGCWVVVSSYDNEADAIAGLEERCELHNDKEWCNEAHTAFQTGGYIYRVSPQLTDMDSPPSDLDI